ncbi:MAG: hypothetical protein ACFFD2_05770 [Promethearchaeota archaeon]
MRIYICKNCGNLTESEHNNKLFCSTCGAPLTNSKQEEEETSSQATAVSAPPHPIDLGSKQHTTEKISPRPSQEIPTEADETKKPPLTSEPAAIGITSRQKEVPLDSPGKETSPPSSSSEVMALDTSTQQAEVSLDSAPTPMEIFEDKNLVVCPQCSYGCNPSWSKCPICNAEIANASDLKKITEADLKFDKTSLKEKLISCPKCDYSCNPNWESCPICQTKLEKSD